MKDNRPRLPKLIRTRERPRADPAQHSKSSSMSRRRFAIAPDVVKADALGFSTRVLVQAGLPHSNPRGQSGGVDAHERRLLARGAAARAPESGKVDRLSLREHPAPDPGLHLLGSGEARRSARNRAWPRSLADFMRALGLWNSGGVRGDITRVKEQLYPPGELQHPLLLREGARRAPEGHGVLFAQSIADEYCFWWDREPIRIRSRSRTA
jgi:hypothetical protein